MKIYSITDMKDSRMFFDKEPPQYMKYFIYLMAVLLISLILWSTKATKTYVVKSKGLVTSLHSTNISNEIQGTVIDILVKEGEKVKAGDVIIKIDTASQDLQTQSLKNQKELLERKLQLNNQYEKAINEKKNTFKASGDELEFYGKMKYYLGEVESYNNTISKSDKEFDEYKRKINDYTAQIAKYTKTIEEYNTQISKYSSEITSIEKQISDIEKQVNEIQKTISSKEGAGEDTAEIIKKEDNLQAKVSEKQSQKSEIENKKQEIETKKSQIEAERQTAESGKESSIKDSEYSKENKTSTENQKDSLKSQLISQLGQERSQINAQIIEIEGKYLVDKAVQKKFDVTALSDGIIHYNTSLKKGMTIQTGTHIGTILSENIEDLIIDAFVTSNERTKINELDDVDIVVDGLMQTKYGYLKGLVKRIEKDSTVDNESKAVFFKTKILLNNTYLQDKNGTKVNLKPGMTTEVRIKYDESTWFEWVLEQINVIIR